MLQYLYVRTSYAKDYIELMTSQIESTEQQIMAIEHHLHSIIYDRYNVVNLERNFTKQCEELVDNKPVEYEKKVYYTFDKEKLSKFSKYSILSACDSNIYLYVLNNIKLFVKISFYWLTYNLIKPRKWKLV